MFFEACLKSCEEFKAKVAEKTESDRFDDLTEKLTRGEGGDISIVADILSEEIFVRNLSAFGEIYSEESGRIGSGELTVYLDPLDGSDNFSSRIPYYGVSVCLADKERQIESFICNFATGEIFYKRDELLLSDMKSGKNFKKPTFKKSGIGLFERAYSNPHICEKLFAAGYKYRSPGALALSMAYAVNCGFLVYAGKGRVFDIIAGLHILDGAFLYQGDEVSVVSYDEKVFTNILNSLGLQRG